MKNYELKNHREVCWDMALVGESNNVKLEVHKPTRKNVVLDCNADWEVVGVAYLGVMKLGDTYRMYYRGRDKAFWTHYKNRFLLAESKDGKSFERVPLGKFEFEGSRENNIFHFEDRPIDNFAIIYDENPDCPSDAKFKALSAIEIWLPEGGKRMGLLYYKSSDGITFERVGELPVPGVFDSYNIALWDSVDNEYKMYIRDFHDHNGTTRIAPPGEHDLASVFRDVRLTRSKDFVTWSTPEMIEFDDGNRDLELYTSLITKYKRAHNMYVGFPTRYNNRPNPKDNYNHLPDWNGERIKKNATGSRIGTVFNDTTLITSRDGLNFNRLNEAYMTPGLQRPDNWYYEDCFLAYDMLITDSDEAPGTPEISLYRAEGFNVSTSRIVRYTVRLDGFYSWHADFSGGSVTTIPLTFEGDSLDINFATSALGHIRIIICDENGEPIDGYDSDLIWGDMVTRNVTFEKPLSELNGKTVCLRFELKDADLYSFKFN